MNYGDGSGAQALALAPDKTFALSHAYTAPGVYTVTVSVSDGQPGGAGADTVRVVVGGVAGRHVFYNQSFFDGNSAAANANDDNAVATNKTALLPGQTASFANYTSYSRGINGIMVDLPALPEGGGGLSSADFLFRVGNDNNPAAWAAAPSPSGGTVRPGAGVNGSDRVTLTWANNAIQKQWLQVTVLPTANTGLSQPDVFYFGNAIGESGNTTANAFVNATDELGARNNPRSVGNPAPVTFRFDYNRDRFVNATDQLIARNNKTSVADALRLISVPAAAAAPLAGTAAPAVPFHAADGVARPWAGPRKKAVTGSAPFRPVE